VRAVRSLSIGGRLLEHARCSGRFGAELLADERRSQAVLVFLATTDVGRVSGPPVAGDGDGEASEASEWEYREREEQLAFLRRKRKGLGLLSVTCHLSFVFHFPTSQSASERQPIRRSGKMLTYIPRVMINYVRIH